MRAPICTLSEDGVAYRLVRRQRRRRCHHGRLGDRAGRRRRDGDRRRDRRPDRPGGHRPRRRAHRARQIGRRPPRRLHRARYRHHPRSCATSARRPSAAWPRPPSIPASDPWSVLSRAWRTWRCSTALACIAPVLADPGDYGITNLTEPCTSEPSALYDCEGYAYFDPFHPTEAIHELFAGAATEAADGLGDDDPESPSFLRRSASRRRTAPARRSRPSRGPPAPPPGGLTGGDRAPRS